MTDQKLTIGQAIDQIIKALELIEEGSRPTVLATVCAHLGIPTTATIAMKPSIPATVPASVLPLPQNTPHPHAGAPAQLDIRTLKNQKQPESATQMACLVAYYLQEVAPEGERKT